MRAMKPPLSCVVCSSEDDFDLLLVRHPVSKKPLALTFCCPGCKPKLLEEIRIYAGMTLKGMDAVITEADAEMEGFRP